jgi:hypothetical protein
VKVTLTLEGLWRLPALVNRAVIVASGQVGGDDLVGLADVGAGHHKDSVLAALDLERKAWGSA